jgi:hypothetical protein
LVCHQILLANNESQNFPGRSRTASQETLTDPPCANAGTWTPRTLLRPLAR